jgi:hypothetical protein
MIGAKESADGALEKLEVARSEVPHFSTAFIL